MTRVLLGCIFSVALACATASAETAQPVRWELSGLSGGAVLHVWGAAGRTALVRTTWGLPLGTYAIQANEQVILIPGFSTEVLQVMVEGGEREAEWQ